MFVPILEAMSQSTLHQPLTLYRTNFSEIFVDPLTGLCRPKFGTQFRLRGHVRAFESGDMSPHSKSPIAPELGSAKTPVMNWPHGPAHWLFEPGLYMITTGTYKKLSHLSSPERLDFFQEALFEYASEFGWALRAWAVLSNHYHFVAASPAEPTTLRKFLGKLHADTARQLNRWDKVEGRKVSFQFWDSHITFERSYLARLK
jgi:REP element-mobilizing transposase RayT